MVGGNPLLTEEHYLLLDFLMKNKRTNLCLRYNTNFSILEYKGKNILDYWKQFDNVEILASIDAHEKLGEYIRKGFNWDQFVKNRDAIRELPHIKFKIAPTISVLSIANLPDLYKTCLELDIIEKEGIYINILERPHFYNTKAIPASIKAEISKSFDQFYIWAIRNKVPKSVLSRFEECIDYMGADDLSKHWKKFIQETALFDKLRNEHSPFLKDLFETN